MKYDNQQIVEILTDVFKHDVHVYSKVSQKFAFRNEGVYLRKRVSDFLSNEIDSGASLVSITEEEAKDLVGISSDTEDFALTSIYLGGKRICLFCKNGLSFNVIAKFEKQNYLF